MALLLIIVTILVLSLPSCDSSETSSVVSPTATPMPTLTTTLPTATPTPTLTKNPPTVSPTPVKVAMAISNKQRVTAPNITPAEMIELVRGNSDFAFDLYQALSKEDGNLFYSPYSISLALAMTYAGARG